MEMRASALGVLVTGAEVLIFVFLWRLLSATLVRRNPDSVAGKAMGSLL